MKDNVYSIVLVLWALWYLSVLAVWVFVGRNMGLFGHYTLIGWSKVGAAFLFSLAANFLLNPLFWAIAGSCIRAAKEEGRVSKLQFYPKLLGAVLVGALLFSVYTNIKSNKKDDQPDHAPSIFKSADVPGTTEQRLPNVSGIMFYGDPSALVDDGQVIKKGDQINGFEVLEIREKMVIFKDKDGKVFEERVQ